MEALIRKYRSGAISEAEGAELLAHAEEETLKALLHDMQQSFLAAEPDELLLDRQRAARMRQEIWQQVRPRKKIRPLRRWLIPAAAALLCVAGAAYLLQKRAADTEVWQELATAAGEQQRIVLPDSTVVYLNGKSTLSYPSQFQGAQRVVQLSGEAFFEVSHNPKRPFFVVGKDFTTKVLGTAFNVDTDLAPGIAVAEGKVQVVSVAQERVRQIVDQPTSWWSTLGLQRPARVDDAWSADTARKEAILTANQYLSVDTVSGGLALGQGSAPNWRTGELAFYNTRIEQIALQLNRYYGEQIEVDEAIKGCEVTLPAMNKSLEQVLHTLARLRQGTAVKTQQTWLLRGKGC